MFCKLCIQEFIKVPKFYFKIIKIPDMLQKTGKYFWNQNGEFQTDCKNCARVSLSTCIIIDFKNQTFLKILRDFTALHIRLVYTESLGS